MKANAGDPENFVFAIQFDVEEPETYKRVMSGPTSNNGLKLWKKN